jgi:D-arginine dehydrogenase
MTEKFDILVVGGGISGISLAARLAGKRRIAVLEAEEHLGKHATGRSAAMLVEAYGPPVIRKLTARARPFLEQPPALFSETPLSRRQGSLVYAAADGVEQLREEFETAAETAEVTWLDADSVLAACPLLKPGIAAAGFMECRSLDLDANALLQGFARMTRRTGSEILTSSPVRGIVREAGVWRATAGERELTAEVLVNATGAWADIVAALAGIPRRGLQPKRRTAATIDVPPGLVANMHDTPLTMPVDTSFYFKPSASSIMVSLSEEAPCEACDAWPEELDVALALDRFHAATIVPPVRPTATWAGLRTFAPDGDPVVGFDPEAPGFFWYAGQGGYGIQTSPALSALGAKLVLGEALDDEEAGIAAIVRPDRLAPVPRG